MATPKEKLDRANVTRRPSFAGELADAPGEARWQAWFDGASCPNPGRIGLGGVLLSPAGERHELSKLAGVSGCNNEAELLAMLAVLELALNAGARHIELRGDSDFAIRAGQARWAADSPGITEIPRLVALIRRLVELLGRFDSAVLGWIPRHRNGDADRLSRQALGLPHKPAPVPGRKEGTRRGRA